MAKRFTSINGITIHVCRKIANFSCGEANVYAVRYNYEEYRYDIYVKKKEELKDQLEYFEKFWGRGFYLIHLTDEEVNTIPTTHNNIHPV